MITWPVTKAIEPLRKIPAKEELDATEAMIPDATPMLTEVQQEEAAAVELEDKIKVIGNDMMKVLQTVRASTEPPPCTVMDTAQWLNDTAETYMSLRFSLDAGGADGGHSCVPVPGDRTREA